MKPVFYIGIAILILLLLMFFKLNKKKSNSSEYNIEDITEQLDDITDVLDNNASSITFTLEKNIMVIHSEKTIY